MACACAGCVSHILVPSQSELLIGIHDVNQVVGHALALLGRWLICANVHAPVDLPRIGGHNLGL